MNQVPSNKQFLKHLLRNLVFGIVLSTISLGIGMLGYHHFEEMGWIDAYVNAAMILSGMGPVTELHTDAGKIFAGSYALFSGIIFLVIIAVIFVPVFHRFFKKFHIEESQSK